MKLNYKKILFTLSNATLISLPIIATSCSNKVEQEISTKENRVQPIVFYKGQKKLGQNENLIYVRNKYHNQEQQNKTIKKIESLVQQKLQTLITIDEVDKLISFETDTLLLPKIKEYNGAFKSFNISIDDEVLTLKLNRVIAKLDLGDLGIKAPKNQNAAFNIKDFNYNVIFEFDVLKDNKKVVGFIEPLIKFAKQRRLTAPIHSNNINENKENFKKINVPWNDASFAPYYYDAILTAHSDGDTFTVQPVENKKTQFATVSKNDSYKIRLAGIDTPEKAVGSGSKSIKSSPFEYIFALQSSAFGEKVLKKNSRVRVAYISGSDTYGRQTADIFFGDNFEYSYNVEIVRAGYSLPYSSSGWEKKFDQKNDYVKDVYPAIFEAFNEAKEKRNGFYKYLTPKQVSDYVYNIKPNSSWQPFDAESEVNVKTESQKQS
ncbi:thermonuclease family protein [Mycoplasma leonicaptivi]|uniref:thermonuclease family protein n=1 Tax=Mycoplasma leonicaptivi TaxID=36742 RepID=UPI000684E339|nr:thermonuclease family protein [Mycoplasma leonicaptivi]